MITSHVPCATKTEVAKFEENTIYLHLVVAKEHFYFRKI